MGGTILSVLDVIKDAAKGGGKIGIENRPLLSGPSIFLVSEYTARGRKEDKGGPQDWRNQAQSVIDFEPGSVRSLFVPHAIESEKHRCIKGNAKK